MCNIVHTCIKKYTVAVQYSCKFCTARVFLFLADHAAIQFTNILKLKRYLCADEAKGLLVPYVPLPARRGLPQESLFRPSPIRFIISTVSRLANSISNCSECPLAPRGDLGGTVRCWSRQKCLVTQVTREPCLLHRRDQSVERAVPPWASGCERSHAGSIQKTHAFNLR